MSLLVIWEILGHFVNALTADDKYSLCNSENLLQLIQMQLPRKLKTLSEIFAPFIKYISYFKHFEKKDEPQSLCIYEITGYESLGSTNV